MMSTAIKQTDQLISVTIGHASFSNRFQAEINGYFNVKREGCKKAYASVHMASAAVVHHMVLLLLLQFLLAVLAGLSLKHLAAHIDPGHMDTAFVHSPAHNPVTPVQLPCATVATLSKTNNTVSASQLTIYH